MPKTIVQISLHKCRRISSELHVLCWRHFPFWVLKRNMGIAGNSLKVSHLFFLGLQSSLTFSIPEAWQLEHHVLRVWKVTHPLHIPFFKKYEFHLKSEWNISTSSEHLPVLGLLSEKENMKIIISLPSDESPAGFTQQRRNTGKLLWRKLLATPDLTLFFLGTKPERVN